MNENVQHIITISSLINLFHSIWSVCRYIFSRKKSKNDLECIQLKPWLHKMGFFSDFADSNIFSVLVIIWSKICFAVSIIYRMKLQEESYKGHLSLNIFYWIFRNFVIVRKSGWTKHADGSSSGVKSFSIVWHE